MQEDFESKYTKQNSASSLIINRFYTSLAQLSALIQVDNALEVGCGAGFSTERLIKILDCPFEAIEVEHELVEKARLRNPSININQGSTYQLEYDDDAFDLLYILEVLEHLEFPEQAMNEVTRVARKWVIASVPREPLWCFLNFARGKYWTSLGNTPGHINHWSSKRFVNFLSNYGEVIEYRQPLPWTICLLKVS